MIAKIDGDPTCMAFSLTAHACFALGIPFVLAFALSSSARLSHWLLALAFALSAPQGHHDSILCFSLFLLFHRTRQTTNLL
jgi:hypothetical protein